MFQPLSWRLAAQAVWPCRMGKPGAAARHDAGWPVCNCGKDRPAGKTRIRIANFDYKRSVPRVPCFSPPGLPALAALLCCLALLAGCNRPPTYMTMGPVDEMLPQHLPDQCGAADLAALTGSDFTSLADHQLVGPLRVLWPGQEITAEIQAARLNAQVNTTGRILRLFCG